MKHFRLSILLLLIYSSAISFVVPVEDLESSDPTCYKEGAFYCLDMRCITSEQYCDGVSDCSDGSDENFCTEHLPNPESCNETHQFLCGDKLMCIPSTWVCNGEYDCRDHSDEFKCEPYGSDPSCGKGFKCDGNRCISQLWVCDGKLDCEDKTDEDTTNTCKNGLSLRKVNDGINCRNDEYVCADSSFCVQRDRICDGVSDCRDGTDEGPYCKSWRSMCDKLDCRDGAWCKPGLNGPECYCGILKFYNETSRLCQHKGCGNDAPVCSHICSDIDGTYMCHCDLGYLPDSTEYLCFAPSPEPQLFFSTRNDIRYVNLNTKSVVVLTDKVKKAHGIAFDGTYVYWVDTAQGYQAIYRAPLMDRNFNREVVVTFGLEEPSDVALDHYGGNIYFGDTQRHAIFVCKMNGSMCMTLQVGARSPKFVTLNPRKGQMYWADWHNVALILMANMDGTKFQQLVDKLKNFPTGLALDAPNDRLYFVDEVIKVVRLDNKRVYTLFDAPIHHPYAIAVFENTVYFNDWVSNTIQTFDKVHRGDMPRRTILQLDRPVYGMYVYHPLMTAIIKNPCFSERQYCSHFCLLSGPSTFACGCPDGLRLVGDKCESMPTFKRRFIIAAAGASVMKIPYNTMGIPDSEKVTVDMNRVQAMAYDNMRNVLYLYDGSRKFICYLNIDNFEAGIANIFLYDEMENIVDMQFDFLSDNLYVLDASRRVIEVISVRNKMRAFVAFFKETETPISVCVIPPYGLLLVAVKASQSDNLIHVESMGLDGSDRKRFPVTNLKGPYVRLRYSMDLDLVFMSDEGRRIIEQIHATGAGRNTFRNLGTSVVNLAVTDAYIFWTEQNSYRLYWADPYDTNKKIRRIDLSILAYLRPPLRHLHIVATIMSPDLTHYKNHPCFQLQTPCSHVCVQKYHTTLQPLEQAYKCLCPPGLVLEGNKCIRKKDCKSQEIYCHKSNMCLSIHKKCDGVPDCTLGEDEEGCPETTTQVNRKCPSGEKFCYGKCISQTQMCTEPVFECAENEQRCGMRYACVARTAACDGRIDCPDGSDEDPALCDTFTCEEHEFMCSVGYCIPGVLHCDGSEDCHDGSDEIGCLNSTCGENIFQCHDGRCVAVNLRCNGQADCPDHSDEADCNLPEIPGEPDMPGPTCPFPEVPCKYNESVCILPTARCNGKTDCPGGSDEEGCDKKCKPFGSFICRQEMKCISESAVCNGLADCSDLSDETFEACAAVGKVDSPHAKQYVNGRECGTGYKCNNSHCLDWAQVCDYIIDCLDASDENGLCKTSCGPGKCEHICQPTPRGHQCVCFPGYMMTNGSCQDIDECAYNECSQKCKNVIGSFECSCHDGYKLSKDRRTCKATGSAMTVLYSTGGEVWSIPKGRSPLLVYADRLKHSISDIGFNIWKERLYIASREGKKVDQIGTTNISSLMVFENSITNIGIPSKIAVDWITDNVYIVDATPRKNKIRVCHVDRRRCAVLTEFDRLTTVESITVDATNHRLFYVTKKSHYDFHVISSDLSGKLRKNITTLHNCTGIVADPFTQNLYISNSRIKTIHRVNYEGENFQRVLNVDSHITSPQNLELFEDYIYFINGSNLNRCKVYGNRACETFTFIPANSFVIKHEINQRKDVRSMCENFACSNICVLGEIGPFCICPYRNLKDGNLCLQVAEEEEALFNGKRWKQNFLQDVTHSTIIGVLAVMLLLSGVVFFVCKCSKRNAPAPGEFLNVRYDVPTQAAHVAEMNEEPAIGEQRHEYSNPLEGVRKKLRDSLQWTAGVFVGREETRSTTQEQRPLVITASGSGSESTTSPNPVAVETASQTSGTESDIGNKEEIELVTI